MAHQNHSKIGRFRNDRQHFSQEFQGSRGLDQPFKGGPWTASFLIRGWGDSPFVIRWGVI